ncbi:MAG: hypothetical protein AB7E61_00970 [Acholeplasmataceae bacterium]
MITVILVLLLLLITNVMTTSLNILAISGIFLAMIYKWNKIFQKAIFWYIFTSILAIVAVIFHDVTIAYYVTKGYISFALIWVVMMVGVLPNKSELARKIKKVRGVLSIMSFILITPHAMLHIFQIYSGVNLFGIVSYALMLPLTIISFQIIRREMKPKDWITVQKGAYIIYIALFAHLLWVGLWPDKVIYAILFTLYVNNKLIKELKK